MLKGVKKIGDKRPFLKKKLGNRLINWLKEHPEDNGSNDEHHEPAHPGGDGRDDEQHEHSDATQD